MLFIAKALLILAKHTSVGMVLLEQEHLRLPQLGSERSTIANLWGIVADERRSGASPDCHLA
jgi:hypothetical protein